MQGPSPLSLSLVPAFAQRPAPAGEPSLRLVSGGGAALSIGVVLHDFALGGTERIAVRLASRWAAEGMTVRLFVGRATGPLAALLDPRVELVVASPPIPRARGSQRVLGEAAARHFALRPVDACFVPGNYHWPVAAALARMTDGVRPVVAAQISAALHKPQRGALRQFFYNRRMRRLVAGADVAVAMCERAGEQADTILRRAMSRAIALPALDEGALTPHPVDPDCRTILAAGRLVREKGFDLLIAAFARLPNRADARLVIVGEGPERARLEAQVGALGLGAQIELPGYVPDIRPWLDRARLFVLSSRFEGYGAVIVEALAAGRQVVATACTPAVDELLVDATVGRAVPIDDAGALSHAIAAMLAAPAADPMRLAALVDHHRIGVAGREYLGLFRRLATARLAAAG
jgi:glycosyltransferase involved in cell wall biosynthesis